MPFCDRPISYQAITAAIFLFILGICAPAAVADPYIIENDRGGLLDHRLKEIEAIRASGNPVQIHGRYCYSSCTMFLGLPKTCVSPDVVFGFHGPSRNGKPLSKDIFEYFSTIIASHYPPPLAEWYLSTGRKKIMGVSMFTGQELIKKEWATPCNKAESKPNFRTENS